MTGKYEFVENNIKKAEAFGEELIDFHMPRWEELPSIGLYVDQVITYINEALSPVMNVSADKEERASFLTKSMINNYVKNNLVWAPEKKLYGKEQLAKLFIIAVVKNCYSMSDISDFVNYSLEGSEIPTMYNRFCDLFEQSLDCVFNHKVFITSEDMGKMYVQKTVMQSCANKIYAGFLLKDFEEKVESKPEKED